ncbi:MAG TPA: ubiquinone/menaquinone biosynthesis methyltransferase [Rectinemataceae bacterium]|nr:ubiquinone/menaquinone biosynthesis methyltransferase [Rectinemataceae bacterium]
MHERPTKNPRDKRYLPVAALDATRRTMVVKDIFASAPPTYDRLNHLLSFRRDIAWRRETVRRMRFPATRAFLDVATGTGDLAIAAALHHPEISVKGVDFAEPMLEVGRRKVLDLGLEERVQLGFGDALALPFPDSSFDVAAIAFGMRNIPDKRRALAEMARVVTPGGLVMVLEFTFAPSRGFRRLYGFYLKKLLPSLARLIVKDTSAYHYLADSILAYPRPEAFDQLMAEAGLSQIEHFALTLGTVYLHIGSAPKVTPKAMPPAASSSRTSPDDGEAGGSVGGAA